MVIHSEKLNRPFFFNLKRNRGQFKIPDELKALYESILNENQQNSYLTPSPYSKAKVASNSQFNSHNKSNHYTSRTNSNSNSNSNSTSIGCETRSQRLSRLRSESTSKQSVFDDIHKEANDNNDNDNDNNNDDDDDYNGNNDNDSNEIINTNNHPIIHSLSDSSESNEILPSKGLKRKRSIEKKNQIESQIGTPLSPTEFCENLTQINNYEVVTNQVHEILDDDNDNINNDNDSLSFSNDINKNYLPCQQCTYHNPIGSITCEICCYRFEQLSNFTQNTQVRNSISFSY